MLADSTAANLVEVELLKWIATIARYVKFGICHGWWKRFKFCMNICTHSEAVISIPEKLTLSFV